MFGEKLFPSATGLSDFVSGLKSNGSKDSIRRTNSTVTLPFVGKVQIENISNHTVQAAVALTAIVTIFINGRNYLLTLNNQYFPS